MGPFYKGDQPSAPIEIELDADEVLDDYTTATAEFRGEDGELLDTLGPVPITDGTVTLEWPEDPFNSEGVYTFSVTLHGGGSTLHAGEVEVVVEQRTGWHTLASARRAWSSDLDDLALFDVLRNARIQCEEFAPKRDDVPENYRRAQLVQARNLHNAQAANPSSGDYGESFALAAIPMTWQVMSLLRPSRGRPLVG